MSEFDLYKYPFEGLGPLEDWLHLKCVHAHGGVVD